MAYKGAADRRLQKTEDALAAAYFELVRKNGSNGVTVTELTKRANVARKTFYLHYSTMDDFTYALAMRRASKHASKVAAALSVGGQSFAESFNVLATFLDKWRSEMGEIDQLLTDTGRQRAVAALLKRCENDLAATYTAELGIGDAEARACISFLAGGATTLFSRSYKGDSLSLEEAASLADAMRDAAHEKLRQQANLAYT